MTRNIGLPVKESKNKIEENEKNNPFNGSLSIRGKLFEGTVIDAKAKGTVVIQKESPIYFKKFKDLDEVKIRYMHMFLLTLMYKKETMS